MAALRRARGGVAVATARGRRATRGRGLARVVVGAHGRRGDPVWVVLSDFFGNQGNLIDQLFSSGQSAHTRLGNLSGR